MNVNSLQFSSAQLLCVRFDQVCRTAAQVGEGRTAVKWSTNDCVLTEAFWNNVSYLSFMYRDSHKYAVCRLILMKAFMKAFNSNTGWSFWWNYLLFWSMADCINIYLYMWWCGSICEIQQSVRKCKTAGSIKQTTTTTKWWWAADYVPAQHKIAFGLYLRIVLIWDRKKHRLKGTNSSVVKWHQFMHTHW